jgi:hypothetical protein
MTDYGTTDCCPHCYAGPTSIYVRGSDVQKAARTDDPDASYYCRDCQQAFDELAQRDRSRPGGYNGGGLAAQLDAADPDDVSADGGRSG